MHEEDMTPNPQYDSPYAERSIPESGQLIEILDQDQKVRAMKMVEDNLGYSMNGCFRVRDKEGVVHLVTKSRNSKSTLRWKAISSES